MYCYCTICLKYQNTPTTGIPNLKIEFLNLNCKNYLFFLFHHVFYRLWLGLTPFNPVTGAASVTDTNSLQVCKQGPK